MRKRSRRLRKKLHLGEFQELGFEVSITLKTDLETNDLDQFFNEFILDAIEKNGLAACLASHKISQQLGLACRVWY